MADHLLFNEQQTRAEADHVLLSQRKNQVKEPPEPTPTRTRREASQEAGS